MPAYFEKPLSKTTTRWRIFYKESVVLNPQDEKSDFEELRGKADTRIYRHGQEELAVSSDIQRIQKQLRLIPGLQPKTGSVFLFPDALMDTIAKAINARKKVNLPPEQVEIRQERMRKINTTRLSPIKIRETTA